MGAGHCAHAARDGYASGVNLRLHLPGPAKYWEGEGIGKAAVERSEAAAASLLYCPSAHQENETSGRAKGRLLC